MKHRKTVSTKYEILQCATKLFLEKGYTLTYVTSIATMLDISTGNLTFHFPTKEHILAELIKELCELQKEVAENSVKGEHYLLEAYLLELAMIASVCMENPNIKDLIMAAYTHSLSLGIIRENDTKRAIRVFGKYTPDWEETDYIQAENIVSGIEYAMFMTENTEKISFEQRVTGSMNAIMKIYDIPEIIRKSIICDVMSVDYRSKGRHVFEDFCNYVEGKIER